MPAELNQRLRINPVDLPAEGVIFGCTQAMRDMQSKIEHLRSSDLPVLIQGESGTGKEVIARFLHTRSTRQEAPFVKLNCAAVPHNLLECELFGCEDRESAGENTDRPGLVEIAGGGTLFLDEIGEMEWNLQGKLLRLLQDGSYTRMGGREERVAQIRVICATKADLERAVKQGAFREDLFSRIGVACLRLPPLRERKSDIPQLCDFFLEKLATQFNRTAPKLNPVTLHMLKQWNWPGNLRELENCITRAIVLGEDATLGIESRLQLAGTGSGVAWRRRSGLKGASRARTSVAASSIILRSLQANRWNRRKTAEELNMSYRSLLDKLREVGVPQRRRNHRDPPRAQ